MKRSYGSGTYYSRGVGRDGRERWLLRWRDKRGRHAETISGTASDARRELRARIVDADRGVGFDSSVTFAEWSDRWIANRSANLKPRSLASYEYTVEHYLQPALGPLQLVNIDDADVQRLVDKWRKAGANDGAIRKRHTMLRMILGEAVDHGLIGRNVARLVKAPRYRRQPFAVPTRAEFLSVIVHLRGTPDCAAVAIAGTTGIRQGELLALRWRDVHGAQLDINATADAKGRRQPLKTDAAYRRVTMPASTLALLREHRAGYPNARPDDRIIATSTGTGESVDPRNLTRRWHRALRELGLPAYHWHTLRHYFATQALDAGVELPKLSKTIGHTDIGMTVDTYGHLAADSSTADALAFDLADSVPGMYPFVPDAAVASGRPRAKLRTKAG